MRIYVAPAYTARRETCIGCPQEKKNLYACPQLTGVIADGTPGPDCTEPDVEKRDANVRAADEAGREIARRGHTPFVPHKMTYDWERDDVLIYEDFIRIDDEWLRLCDALLYLRPSSGADRELELAETMSLRIFRSVDEIPDLRSARKSARSVLMGGDS